MFSSAFKSHFNIKNITFTDAFLVFCGLTLPLSTALSSIAFSLAGLSIVFKPGYLKDLRQSMQLPVIVSLLLFMGWMLFTVIYPSFFLGEGGASPKPLLKPLLLFLLIPLFTKENRHWIISAFIISMLVTAILAFVQELSGVTFYLRDESNLGAVFKNRITTSIFMAFACFVMAHGLLSGDQCKKILSGVLLALFSFHLLFLNDGRTGYIIYFSLFILLLTQRFNLKIIAVGLAVIFLVILGVFKFSPIFNERMTKAVQEYELYQQRGVSDTSTGLRLEYYKNSLELFKQRPVLGWGTGAFGKAYQTIPDDHKTMDLNKAMNIKNPHNQFLLIAVENGSIGLLFFLAFLACCSWVSFSMPQNMSFLFQGMLVTFVIGSIGNSLLLDHSEGFFFILFCAMGLSTLLKKEKLPSMKLLSH